MLRRRAGTVEGRDRWGAACGLLLLQKGSGYRHPVIHQPFVHKEEEARPERASWRLAPAPESLPGHLVRWVCQMVVGLRGWCGWGRRGVDGKNRYTQHVRNFNSATKRDAALLLPGILLGIVWTAVVTDLSLCLLQLWCVYFACHVPISYHHCTFHVLHSILWLIDVGLNWCLSKNSSQYKRADWNSYLRPRS